MGGRPQAVYQANPRPPLPGSPAVTGPCARALVPAGWPGCLRPGADDGGCWTENRGEPGEVLEVVGEDVVTEPGRADCQVGIDHV